MILHGRKVILRAIEYEDLDLLRDLSNDPEIEFMVEGYAYPISKKHEEIWYEHYLEQKDPLRWMIETEKDGTVGMVTLGDFDWKNRVAHLTGIKLKTDKVTESGIAIDALNTVVGYGFDELNLNRIEGAYLAYNKQSMAMNRMVGFKDEGCFRKAVYKRGEYHDLIPTAILKEDYYKRRERHVAKE